MCLRVSEEGVGFWGFVGPRMAQAVILVPPTHARLMEMDKNIHFFFLPLSTKTCTIVSKFKPSNQLFVIFFFSPGVHMVLLRSWADLRLSGRLVRIMRCK